MPTPCPGCGALLPRDLARCPKCGTEVQAGAASAIGGPDTVPTEPALALRRLVPKEYADKLLATRGPVEAERRQVTILFSDVKGSSALAEALDPEDVLEIMNGAFEVLIEPVYRHEGTLARLMGDAILAFFGAPIAHEDDPERAIRAALEIQAGVQAYAAKLARERGIQGFNVRVGINTGLVVVGEVGSDLRVEYTAMGDAINLAARMEQNAPAGGILITADTYRHVRGVFEVQALEPIEVKGKTQPVQPYLVMTLRPPVFQVRTRGVEGIETRLVGREAELSTLQSVFNDVLETSKAQVVIVSGEAGVGKSRLLYEFNNWISRHPQRVYLYKGRASAATRSVPYSLLRTVFAYRFGILDSDSAATALAKFRAGMAGILEPEKADLVGQLAGFDFSAASPYVAALLGSDSFGQSARAYLTQFIRLLVSRQPLVVLLEDLHWADGTSLDLVAHLLREISGSPFLVVGLARPEFFEHRPGWGAGLEAYTHLLLKPLSPHSSQALVTEILQRVPQLPDSLRDLVVRSSEGNPFYIEELIKMLIEDGVIVVGEGDQTPWRVAADRLAEVRVPPSLTAVLQARLDALPSAERAVLQRAAVVGRQFWDTLVAELSADALAPAEVDRLLRSAHERELIFRQEHAAFHGTNEYVFKHALLRDVAYETLLHKLRRRYHALVACWLEVHAGERLSEYLGLIAGHYEHAGKGTKAAEYLWRSGEEALKVGACRDAQAAYERALKLVPAISPLLQESSETGPAMALRAALLVGLGRARVKLGEHAAASAPLEEGVALARAAGDRRSEVAALNCLGNVGWRQGRWDAAQTYLTEALATAQSCCDQAGQALAARGLGIVASFRGQYDDAVRWALQSQALCAELGDRQGVGSAFNLLGNIADYRRDFRQAARYYGESLEICRKIGDRRGMALAFSNLGGTLTHEQGVCDEARAYYEQARTILEELGDRWAAAIQLLNLGEMCVIEGQDAAAWRYLRPALQEFYALQATPDVLYTLVDVGRLWARTGQPERAAELLGLAMGHPAWSADTALIAEPLDAALRQALPAAELEVALERGKMLDLARVVTEILG